MITVLCCSIIWISIIASALTLASANDPEFRKHLQGTNKMNKKRSLLEEATSFVTDDDVIPTREEGNIGENQGNGVDVANSNSGNGETLGDVDDFIKEEFMHDVSPENDDIVEVEQEMAEELNNGGDSGNEKTFEDVDDFIKEEFMHDVAPENDDIVEVEQEMEEEIAISISSNVELNANYGDDDDIVEVENEMNTENEDIPNLEDGEHYIDSNIATNRNFLQDDDDLGELDESIDDDVAQVYDNIMKEAETMDPPSDVEWLMMLNEAKNPSAQYHQEQQQQLDKMVKGIGTNKKDDDTIDTYQHTNVGDDETMSEENTVSPFNSLIDTSLPWHEQINIPYVEKKSLTYDIVLGCSIAFAFTMVLLVAFCILHHCFDCPSFLDCLYVEKDHPHHWNQRRRTRKRQPLGSNYKHNNFILQWLGNRKEQMYYSIVETPEQFHKRERQSLMKNKRSNVSVDSWGTESDDEYGELPPMDPDMDRLEYGESIDSDYDDDVDYSLIDKDTGRYEKDQIENAAEQYFSEDRVKKFFTAAHTVDSDSEDSNSSDSSDSPLDLEMIEKKMVRSIENANAFTGKK